MTDTSIIILDFEASGLHPESYPIQVGWFDVITGEQDGFYITPAPTWTYWDCNAQDVHGISRDFLVANGIDATEGAERLNARLAGKSVYSDAAGFDGYWLEELFYAADVDPAFTLYCVTRAVPEAWASELNEKLKDINLTHDALQDARDIGAAVRAVLCL